MSFFKIENPLIRILIRIANMMILSFFWVLCCIPLVTILPANAALFHTTTKVLRTDGSGVVKDFFLSFKGSLKKGIPLSILFLLFGALLWFLLTYGFEAQKIGWFGTVYFLLGIGIAFVYLMMLLMAGVALSRYEGGIAMYLRMSLFLALKRFPSTLAFLALLALCIFLIYVYPVVLLLLPGLYTDLTCAGMEKKLKLLSEAIVLPGDQSAAEGKLEEALESAEDASMAESLEESEAAEAKEGETDGRA